MEQSIGRIEHVLKLMRYVKGMWRYLVLSALANLLYKILPIVLSVTLSYMIGLTATGKIHDIRQWFFVVLAMILGLVIMSYLNVLISHDMAYRILAKLRSAAYRKIDEIAPAGMEARQSGELISIVLEDVELLEWFYAHTIGQIMTACMIPLMVFVVLWLISPILTLSLLPFVLALILIPIFGIHKSNEQGFETRKQFANLNAQMIDGVQGLKDIISFQWQQNFFRRFSEVNEKYHDAQMRYALRSADEMRLFQMIVGVGSLAGQIIALMLAINGRIPISQLIPIFILCSAVFSPIMDALTMSTNYGLIFSAAKRLFDLFQSQSVVIDHGEKNVESVLGGNENGDYRIRVVLKDVHFSYPEDHGRQTNRVLKGLSFEFSTGETVALVGASGSGKSTVAKLLQRFWDVDSGSIEINNVDIRSIRMKSLRKLVTIVPQEAYLFNMSIEKNLLLANPEAHVSSLYQAAADAQAASFINRLPDKYETVVGERGLKLSGGEKQRLSIAQAFLKDSPILILDEISANLDSENEKRINEAVERIKAGRATLVIAHRVSTMRAADRVVVIRDGCVVGNGSYSLLLDTCPYFKELIGEEYVE